MNKQDLLKIFQFVIKNGSPIELPVNGDKFPELVGLESPLQQLAQLMDGQATSVELKHLSLHFESNIHWTIPMPRNLAQEASAMVVATDGKGNRTYLSIGDSSNTGHLYIVEPETGALQILELPIMKRRIDWEAIALVEDTDTHIKLVLMNNKGSSKATKRNNPGLLYLTILKGWSEKGETPRFHTATENGIQKLPKAIGKPRDVVTHKRLAARMTCEAMAITTDGRSCTFIVKRKRINVKRKKKEPAKKYLRRLYDNQRVTNMSNGQLYSGPILQAGRNELILQGSLYQKAHHFLSKKCPWANVATDACYYGNELFVLCHDETSTPKIVQLDALLDVKKIYELQDGFIKPEGLFVSEEGLFLADEGSGEKGDEYDNGSKSFFIRYSWDYIRQNELPYNGDLLARYATYQAPHSNAEELNEAITAFLAFFTDADYQIEVAVGKLRLGLEKREEHGTELRDYDREILQLHKDYLHRLKTCINQLKQGLAFVNRLSENAEYVAELYRFHERVDSFVDNYPRRIRRNRTAFKATLKGKKSLNQTTGFKAALSRIYHTELLYIESDLLGELGKSGWCLKCKDGEANRELTDLRNSIFKDEDESLRKQAFDLKTQVTTRKNVNKTVKSR